MIVFNFILYRRDEFLPCLNKDLIDVILIPFSFFFSGITAHVILIVRGAEKLQSSTLQLYILGTDGRRLHSNRLRRVGRDGVHFSASFPTPEVPFKMQIKGNTKRNFQFERSSQSTVEPRHVFVKVLYARNEFTAPKSGYEFAIFLRVCP